MGKIEDAIMDNYHQSLTEGNLPQASRAVKLAKKLKILSEEEGFYDYENKYTENSSPKTNIFKPHPYRYNREKGYVSILDTPVILTKTENRFFELLSRNETYEDKFEIISKQMIKDHVWPGENVSDNAVRVLIKRLRSKFEEKPHKPQVLINFNSKGYVFMAKRIE